MDGRFVFISERVHSQPWRRNCHVQQFAGALFTSSSESVYVYMQHLFVIVLWVSDMGWCFAFGSLLPRQSRDPLVIRKLKADVTLTFLLAGMFLT